MQKDYLVMAGIRPLFHFSAHKIRACTYVHGNQDAAHVGEQKITLLKVVDVSCCKRALASYSLKSKAHLRYKPR